MIRIPQPSMALNAPDSPVRYRMYVNYQVPAAEEIDVFLRQVRQAALRQPAKSLKCLVFNCHGSYKNGTGGYGFAIARGVRWLNAHHFTLLREGDVDGRPLVDHIVITACGVAAVSPLDDEGDGNGVVLCKKIAMHSGAHVTAANIQQIGGGELTPYYIDDFEGLTRQFAPNGQVTWEHEYDRAFLQTLRFGPN